jgi:uncharacterized protein YgfB (UPF0149 family)
MPNSTFAEINAELRSIEPQLDAAEAHGSLCGALCTVKNLSITDWFGEIIDLQQEPEADDGLEAFGSAALVPGPALELLFSETVDTLNADTMEFNLLLPDDDQPLIARVASMAQWVAGFLYGFGTGAVRMDTFPDSVHEALQDFTQIARANPDEVVESEEDEAAYAELVEYLRAAVQVIYDELAAARAAQLDPQPPLIN